MKKFLSYFFPIKILHEKSDFSKTLDVVLQNGKLILDAKNVNYSYGSLQRILRRALYKIGFEKIQSMNQVLILGVAGGSVIKTLVEEIQYQGKITGVEIDPKVIAIANDYFNLNNTPNLDLIIADAQVFINTTFDKFDLIIIDVFQDSKMPEFLFEINFTNEILNKLNENGIVVFNTMILNQDDQYNVDTYINYLKSKNIKYNVINNVERYNHLITIYK